MHRSARCFGWWARLAALIALTACGEPAPPALTGFVPADPSVIAGQSVGIRVTYEANDVALESFQWTVEAGEIEGDGQATITYRAPDAAGAYQLTVTATPAAQDGAADVTLSTTVEVLPAPAPAVSEASPAAEAGEEQSAGQRAAAAARAALQGTGSAALEAGEEASAAAQTGIASATRTLDDVDREAAAAATVEGAPGEAAARASERSAQRRQPGEERAPASSARAADGVDAIVARGRLVVVVENDFAPFSFEEGGRRVGFEVDMVREFARRWLRDGDAVTFVPVTAEQRIATLQQGDADLIAAALTRTTAREQVVDFSQTYFKDGQRLLVADDADIAGPCDLAGRKVAVVAGTTSLDNIRAEAATCGFDIEDLVVFERRDQAVAALLVGEVDAFTSDGVALQRLAEGQPLKVVGNHFSEEPYGFGLPQGQDRLRRLVDLTLAEMDRDGTYAAIYREWFGDGLSPFPLEADPSLANDEQLMALATTDAAPLFEPQAPEAPAGEVYIVQPGDTLSTIAGRVYGDVGPAAWRAIWEANRETIGDDPNRIRVGMRLTLPATP